MHVTVMLFSYATLICGCLLSITFLFLFDNQFENLFNRSAVMPSYEPKDGFALERNQNSVKNFRSIIEEVYQQDVDQRTPLLGIPTVGLPEDRAGPAANDGAEGKPSTGTPLGWAFSFDALNWNSLNTNNTRFQWSPLAFSKESRPKAQTNWVQAFAKGEVDRAALCLWRSLREALALAPRAPSVSGKVSPRGGKRPPLSLAPRRGASGISGLGLGRLEEKSDGGKAVHPGFRFGRHSKIYRELAPCAPALGVAPEEQGESRALGAHWSSPSEPAQVREAKPDRVPICQQDSSLGFAKSQFPPSTQLVSQGFHFFENERKNLLQKLDQLSFRAIGIGFPFLTIGILSGSVWANEAWGSYWNWDPKETWSLITWIIFAIYLHLRLTKNWDGLKSAILATIGFLSIWICFLGVNFLAKGLHSYGWFH